MSDESTSAGGIALAGVSPAPTDEELAAILSAYEALWPRPSAATEPADSPRWRFAGRHWSPRPRYGGWA